MLLSVIWCAFIPYVVKDDRVTIILVLYAFWCVAYQTRRLVKMRRVMTRAKITSRR